MKNTPDKDLATRLYPGIPHPFIALNSNLQPIAGGNSTEEAKSRGRAAGCPTPLIGRNHTLRYPGVREKFVALEPNYALVAQGKTREEAEKNARGFGYKDPIITEGHNDYRGQRIYFAIDINPAKILAVGYFEKEVLDNAIKSGCANPVIRCNWI